MFVGWSYKKLKMVVFFFNFREGGRGREREGG